jgi:hypothetical protein
MFQVKEISQTKIIFLGISLFNLLEIIDDAILRSIQGSSILNHLDIFIYTS